MLGAPPLLRMCCSLLVLHWLSTAAGARVSGNRQSCRGMQSLLPPLTYSAPHATQTPSGRTSQRCPGATAMFRPKMKLRCSAKQRSSTSEWCGSTAQQQQVVLSCGVSAITLDGHKDLCMCPCPCPCLRRSGLACDKRKSDVFDFATGEWGTCDFTGKRAHTQGSAAAAHVMCKHPGTACKPHQPMPPFLTHAVFDWRFDFTTVIPEKVGKAGTFMAWCTLDG